MQFMDVTILSLGPNILLSISHVGYAFLRPVLKVVTSWFHWSSLKLWSGNVQRNMFPNGHYTFPCYALQSLFYYDN